MNDAEPHPLLWELILVPFSQNNFPVITLNIISLAIVSLALFLFLRFAPLNPFLKLLFLFSNAFFYYNPVIARDYCLVPLAIAFIGMTYKNRHEKPLKYGLALAFLSQTHFLMYGLLGILTLGFMVEEIKSKNNAGETVLNLLKIVLPLGLSILTVLPMVFGSLENQAILTGKVFESAESVGYERPGLIPTILTTVFGLDNSILGITALAVLILFVLHLFAENIKIAIYAIISFGFWFGVLSTLYQSYYCFEQKCSLIVIIILAITWLLALEPKDKKENIILRILNFSEISKFLRLYMKNPVMVFAIILVASTIPRTLVNATYDLSHSFSNSKANAEFINSLPKNTVLIEGDIAAHNQFDSAVFSQITNSEVDIYNVLLDKYLDVNYWLKYDKRYVEDVNYMKEIIPKVEIDDVLKKFTELSEKYEHIYFFFSSNRTACNNYEGSTPSWLEGYDKIIELDTDSGVKNSHSPTYVFKVK